MTFYGYKLGAGYNLPDGSLTNIEDITDSSGRTIAPPKQIGNYSPGDAVALSDKSIAFEGDASDRWEYGYIYRAQVQKIRDDYCNGGWSGAVTFTTQIDESGAYTRHNGQLQLDRTAQSIGNKFVEYTFTFSGVSGTL
mgnify:CR=1 FL=1